MLIKDFDKIAINKCKKVGPKPHIEMALNDPMYCCEEFLKYWINDPRVPFSYSAVFRKYYYMVEKGLHAILGIPACVICKKKWPNSLKYEWKATIIKELGFDPGSKENINKEIPYEFTTDEWWKKRGL
jgi:hypothetical protein